MLELEALNKKAKPEIAVHISIITCSKRIIRIWMTIFTVGGARFGFWFSRPGISHVVHMERFGRPAKHSGSDSHTPAGGGMECLL
jgi:aconitate hydratase